MGDRARRAMRRRLARTAAGKRDIALMACAVLPGPAVFMPGLLPALSIALWIAMQGRRAGVQLRRLIQTPGVV